MDAMDSMDGMDVRAILSITPQKFAFPPHGVR